MAGDRGAETLPWGRPRREALLLVLVALVALSPLYPVNDGQDVSRACLAESLVHARVSADGCLVAPLAVDRSSYGGHFYSDKAPGMSVLEAPTAAAVRLGSPARWPYWSVRLWVVRILASGLAFVLAAFLVGRVSEGLAPGLGGVSLVAFALGTLAAPFAAANFDHVPAGALDLGAFLLAWARRPVLAGLAAGAALLTEYESAAVLVVVAVYVAFQGLRALAHYALGVVPGVLLLGAYDWAAFGAPWHLSYRYLANEYTARQSAGFFGIHVPHAHSAWLVIGGSRVLLVVCPIVIACVYGLVLLARRHRAEALLCAAVAIVFFVVDSGYFAPYGGLSPGPRFFVPALPFLALGLGPAFAAHFRLVLALAAASVVSTTALTVTWTSDLHYRQTVWGELVRLPGLLGDSPLAGGAVRNVVYGLGVPNGAAALACAALALGALALAATGARPHAGG
jgi:hypothetical protein